jgi:arabinofuranosyltransferase
VPTLTILRFQRGDMSNPLNKLRGETSLIGAGMSLSLIICSVYTYIDKEYQRDDALIYYRYISNVLNGNGLVYNIGEKYNALTSPLYTYISILVASIVGNIHYSQVVMCGLFLFLTSFVIMMIFRKQEMTIYGVMAAILIVSTPYYYFAFGMETMLFLFLVALSLYLYQCNKLLLLGIVSGLLFLTRGEGIFLTFTLAIFYYLRNRKLLPRSFFIAFFVVIIPNFLFNYLYFGAWLPHTVTAKMAQGSSSLHKGWSDFLRPSPLKALFQTPFLKSGYLMFTAPVLLVLLSVRLWIKTEIAKILIVFLLFYTSFFIIFKIPAYYWYYAVYFMALTIFAVYGLKAISDYLSGNGLRQKTVGKEMSSRIATGVSLFAFVLLLFFQLASVEKLNGVGPHPHYKDIGNWIKENTPTDSKIAVAEIGHIGWYSERYIIDIGGLVNPYIAELQGKNDFYGWLDYYDPDFIVVHDPLWPIEISAESLLESGEYIEDPDFHFKGYSLLVKQG